MEKLRMRESRRDVEGKRVARVGGYGSEDPRKARITSAWEDPLTYRDKSKRTDIITSLADQRDGAGNLEPTKMLTRTGRYSLRNGREQSRGY